MQAPIKTCPHCSAQSQTPEQKCPHRGKSFIAKKKHTVRNVFLGIIALIILLFAGCTALVGGAANEISKSIEENDNKPGGANNPMEITPGEAFEVDGFNYAAGWQVGKDVLDSAEVTG